MSVHKKVLRPDRGSDRLVVEMPKSAEVVLVAAHGETDEWPTMWYSLDVEDFETQNYEEWLVQVAPTGGYVPNNATHLGTAVMLYGETIRHVYRLEKG